jgi:hypothetical protein
MNPLEMNPSGMNVPLLTIVDITLDNAQQFLIVI